MGDSAALVPDSNACIVSQPPGYNKGGTIVQGHKRQAFEMSHRGHSKELYWLTSAPRSSTVKLHYMCDHKLCNGGKSKIKTLQIAMV
jgi:hypothetical protein